MQNLRKERIKNGLCVSCGKKLDREGYYCKIKNHSHKYHEKGLCVTCGKELDRSGWF